MKILSIETSCDETAVSIIEASGGIEAPKFTILGNALYSQIATHAEYGGVFPMLAKREHTLNLVPMLKLATEMAFEHDTGAEFNDASRSEGSAKAGEKSARTSNAELAPKIRGQILEILSRENDLGPALLDFLDTHEIYDVEAIAVTQGPGLEPALWVGISFAKALALALNKPIIPVNHMEGHIVSVLAESTDLVASTESSNESTLSAASSSTPLTTPAVQFPALALLISGGHTELVLSKGWHKYEIIGQTVDDAIGEAFDKVARIMNLPYPGGPKISKLAAESRAENLREKYKQEAGNLNDSASPGQYPWTLPRPMLRSPDFNFSFSGLKTAVLYAVKDKLKGRDLGERDIKDCEDSQGVAQTNSQSAPIVLQSASQLSEIEIKTLAEEFENAVTEVLVHKTRHAIEETNAQTLIIGGGVIANVYIREAFKKVAHETGIQLFTPSVSLSTDNSVMIGIAGYLRWISHATSSETERGDGEQGRPNLNASARIIQPNEIAELRASGNLSL
jgi:N6-L-threonylcarbamoyladenine synthase